MADLKQRLLQNAKAYAKLQQIKLDPERLGWGEDGDVWKSLTGSPTVIKAFAHHVQYERERDCHLRLQERGIAEIDGFSIPSLIAHDNNLLIVHRNYVDPPYLIDFGKAYLDGEPEHSAETRADNEASCRDTWGDEEHWRQVKQLVRRLKLRAGIYYQDPLPGNIKFRDWEPPLD